MNKVGITLPPDQLPATPEEAEALERAMKVDIYKEYRRRTRPWRRAWRGILTRKECDKLAAIGARRREELKRNG